MPPPSVAAQSHDHASDALDQPSFRNTLSAGDKSTLALALYHECRSAVEWSALLSAMDDCAVAFGKYWRESVLA
jgi:hypothetical protein